MVQMKLRDFSISKNFQKELYIPHGSDETKRIELPISAIDNFISHMVQMKPKE